MPELLSEYQTDLSDGMNDSAATTGFRQREVRLILNGRIEPDGTVSRRPGSRRKHADSLGTGTGYGAVWFRTAAGQDQLLAFVGDAVYVSEDVANEVWAKIDLEDDLREDYWSFATMRVGATMYLFAANGGTNVLRWDGTTLDTLSNAPSGVKYLAVFNGRLWATGHSGVLVQGSRIADPTEWASPFGVTIQAITHDGDEITGLYQIGPHLLVFSLNSTSYIDGYGESTMVVATGATGFSRSVGCIAFRSIAGVGDNAVCWLSGRGIEYYAPGQGIRLLSRRVQRFIDNVDRVILKTYQGRASGCYDGERQEYHLALPSTGGRNDLTLVLSVLQDPFAGQPTISAAACIDRQLAGTEATLLFNGDDLGYLITAATGRSLRTGAAGYAAMATAGVGGDTIQQDAEGYLTVVEKDELPSTLFVGPHGGSGQAIVVHSLGYDGFVRVHYDADNDDMPASGDGGNPVVMLVVTRPFLFRQPRTKKHVRAIHVAAIAPEEASVTMAVRATGKPTAARTKTIRPAANEMPYRIRAMVSAEGDAPQVELATTDHIRIALIGASAWLKREPIP
jgi:hypothetical protein